MLSESRTGPWRSSEVFGVLGKESEKTWPGRLLVESVGGSRRRDAPLFAGSQGPALARRPLSPIHGSAIQGASPPPRAGV